MIISFIGPTMCVSSIKDENTDMGLHVMVSRVGG